MSTGIDLVRRLDQPRASNLFLALVLIRRTGLTADPGSCRHMLMNDTAALVRIHANPRKRDAEATRAAILEAAKAQFALLGYDCAGLRDIASEAGADVALVKRYFGGKEGLFTE